MTWIAQALLLSSIASFATAQLSGPVGPSTSLASKSRIKQCNVLDYGGKADDSTDVGPAISAAVKACSEGGVVIVPQGTYAMETFVSIDNVNGLALQVDGVIERKGTAGGNMIGISNSKDFEMFSSTGKGAIQGNGYIYHAKGDIGGPRILRTTHVENFSVHDLALVDSPAFHFVMDSCSNGEVYNMVIRGGDEGGLDGIDVWGSNIFIHDVMVTNKDECVTVKSPANNILVENIYCNWSGGCAIGSLQSGTDIHDVLYRRVYTWMSNQMMLIKSKDGDGTVRDVVFDNFIGHSNAYSLDIDQYWAPEASGPGAGVQLDNITFSNWHGTEADGAQRGPINIQCADGAPCTDIDISDFAMWTEQGNKQYYTCRSAYGSGFCLKPGDGGKYAAVTSTQTSPPPGYAAPTMSDDLRSAFGTAQSIPIPTHPSSYFPNTPPISAAP